MCIVFLIVSIVIALFITKQFYAKNILFYFKHLARWSREVWHWLCQVREVFGGIFFVFASVVICWLLDWNSKAFIIAGCVLQLAGMAQAIFSLFDVRKYFDPQPITDSLKEWFKRYPKFKRISTVVQGNANVTLGVHATASRRVFPGKVDLNQPIEDILKKINEAIEMLSKETIENMLNVSNLERNIGKTNSDITRELNTIKTSSRKELELLHVGDFTPTLIGFAWIAAGIVLATIGSL